MKIKSVEVIGPVDKFDDDNLYILEAIMKRQTAMDAVIHAHKSGLIGAATFAKLVRVCDPNDQLDQLSEYIGYTVSLDDACAESDERGDVRD
jgi:hypothetical protein